MRILYRNGRVHAPGPAATALATDGMQLVWLGADAAGYPDRPDRTVDLGGALVTAAFVDAHVQNTATGLTLTGLELSGADTLADALDLVERAARAARGRPVLGSGWDESRWPERRPPTSAELDRAAYGGAVYLSRVDGHSAVVSSTFAMAVGGLNGLAGYHPGGLLTGDAHHAARRAAFGALTPAQRLTAHRATRERAAARGVAVLHEMAGPHTAGAEDLAALLALADAEPGPAVVGYWAQPDDLATAVELGAAGVGIYCDGSIGSHTAAWHAPYADRPDTSGRLRHATAELTEHLRRCGQAGLQAAFHAIGDAAVDQVLDAVDLAGSPSGRPAGAGHRIEHAEAVGDPRRLAASGLLASMQPAFTATWGGRDGMYAARLGRHRASGLNRFAALAAAGVPIAFGSAAPVTPLDPWSAVRAAAHPADPAAAIGVEAAFAAHTRGGGLAARDPGAGTLAPGSPATFAVWDDTAGDTGHRSGHTALPRLAPGQPLPTCLRTVIDGRTVFLI